MVVGRGGDGVTRWWRPRSGVAGASRTAVASTPPELEELLAQSQGTEGSWIRLGLTDLELLRYLTVVGQGLLVARQFSFTLAIPPDAPKAWAGRFGHLPGLLRAELSRKTETNEVYVELELCDAIDISTVARAILPALVPSVRSPREGSLRIAVAPSAPRAVLALLDGLGALEPRVEVNPDTLLGSDLVLTGSAHPDDDVPQARAVLHVEEDGVPAGASAPVVDLFVHRPVGRLRHTASGIDVRIEGRTDGWSIMGTDGRPLLSLARGVPLSRADVVSLRKVSRASLGGVLARVEDMRPEVLRDLEARLVELAAVGVELHSGGEAVERLARLDPELRQLLAAPASQSDGIARGIRTVLQRRIAMRRHGGPFVLARGSGLGDSVLPEVSAILVTRRPEDARRVLEELAAQTYPRLEIVVVTHGGGVLSSEGWSQALRERVSHLLAIDSEVPFGEALARASRLAQGALITKVDDDDFYGPEHVWDLVLARMYSGAQIVGKRAEYVFLERAGCTVHRKLVAENYVPVVAGGTILISRGDLFDAEGWRPVPRSVDRGLIERVREHGGLVYATDGLGYLYVRHGRGHTWDVDDARFLERNVEEWHGLESRVLHPGGTPDR